jgi:hypothetical protein
LAGELGAVHVLGVQDVAEFVSCKAVQGGVIGVQFGAQHGAAVFVPFERRAAVAEVFGEGLQVVGGVREFEDSGDDELEVGGRVRGWREDWELIDDEKV